MSKNLYDALASAIYVSAMTANGKEVTTDDQRIRVSGLYDEWMEGAYAVGNIRNANGQTWECYQAHDTTSNPDINPDNAAWYTFWRPLHGKSPETARPFVPVQGAHDMYRTGEYMVYTDGKTYKCLSDTNFSPENYPQAWGGSSMIEGRIREIQERLQATTPGEWKLWEPDKDYFGDDSPIIVTQDGVYIAQTNYDGAHDRNSVVADAEFIAHAKSDMLFLLELLKISFGK